MATPSLYAAYAAKLWQYRNFFGAWPPVMSNIQLGTYGELTSNGFQPLGDIAVLAGLSLPAAPPSSPSAGFFLTSDSMQQKSFAIEGDAEVPVDDVGLVSGDAQIKYVSAIDVGFAVGASDVVRTDIDSSIEDYLRDSVYPALQKLSKGSWNDDWRLVCSTYSASSYVLVGGTGSSTAFNLDAKGSVLGDMGNGSISAQIGITSVNNVSFSTSACQASTPVLIGLGLWHFSKGEPQPDAFHS